jgi:hypothetical protein
MIPLLDFNKLLTVQWPRISDGLQEVLRYANGDDDLARIMKAVLAGELVIWAVNEELDGFITTRLQGIDTCPPQRHLIVDHAWCGGEVQPLTFSGTVHRFLEEYAVKLGCCRIKTYTVRDMAAWMAEWNFSPSYSEYTKEVEL